MIAVLRSNHFYPAKEITVGKKSEKVTGLCIDCSPIMLDDNIKRVEEVLKENNIDAKVWGSSRHQKIYIEKV